MARTSMTRTQPRRTGGNLTRFTPGLLSLEDRAVPATIYVDLGFTGTPGQPLPAGQFFNPTGAGGQAKVDATGFGFIDPTNPGVTVGGNFATNDLTVALNAAQNNGEADTVLLSVGNFGLDNTQGGKLNGNSYIFTGADGSLTLTGLGEGLSAILPTGSTFDPVNFPGDINDPVIGVVGAGASFTGSKFTFDGANAALGSGLLFSAGATALLTQVTVQNVVGADGTGTGGNTVGAGVYVQENAGGSFKSVASSFRGNGRIGIALDQADGRIYGGTFVGRGAGDLVDYGVLAIGPANVLITGAAFSNYKGVASSDGTRSSAVIGTAFTPGGAGAKLLLAGNRIGGNAVGLFLGSAGKADDLSTAVLRYNDLSGNATDIDATQSKGAPGATTGIDAGADAKFNFFGTGGAVATGNVIFESALTAGVPVAAITSDFGATATDLAAAGTQAKADLATLVAAGLDIYVDQTFLAGAGTNPDRNFNVASLTDATSRGGPLANEAKAGLTFLPSLVPGLVQLPVGGVAAGTKIAVSDLTSGLNLAVGAANAADTVYLAADKNGYMLDNGQGNFGAGTYLFSGANGLTLLGSGAAVSVIRPMATTATGVIDAGTGEDEGAFDPVIAVGQGAAFTGTNFTLDGQAAKIGGGILGTEAAKLALTGVGLTNFVFNDGSTTGGATRGYGVYLQANAGGTAVIANGTFSGLARQGVAFEDSDGQVLGGTFIGTGAGTKVQYGVSAVGASNVYVTGASFTNYLGKAVDGTEAAAILASALTQGGAGAALLVVGNKITGNAVGVLTGSSTSNTDTSRAVVRFNDLGNNGSGVDATDSKTGAAAAPGTQAGIDARDNFWGDPTGPLRTARTGSGTPPNTDALTNPTGLGSPAVGNVRIDNFRPATAPTVTIPNAFGSGGTDLDQGNASTKNAYVVSAPVVSEVFVSGPASQAAGPVTYTITFSDPLALAGNQTMAAATTALTALLSGSFLPVATLAAPAPTATAVTPTDVTIAADGRTATAKLAVPAAAVGAGTLTLTLAGSNGSLITINGFSPGGAAANTNSASTVVGQASTNATGPTVALNTVTINGTAQNPPSTNQTIPTVGGTSVATFTVTPGAGTTLTSVTPTSSDPAIATVTQGGTLANPTFTVTGQPNRIGTVTVVVTATGSDGRVTVVPYTVNVTAALTTISGGPTTGVVIPVGGSTSQTFTITTPTGVTIPNPPVATQSKLPDGTNLVSITQTGSNTNPTFTVTGIAGRIGSTVVTVTGTDSLGRTVASNFSVQVGTGTAPTISDLPDTTIPFNGSTGPLAITVGGVDQPLAVTAVSSNPAVATVSVTGTGATRTVTVTADPALTTGGSATVSLTVTDAQGRSTVESFTVTVAPQRVRLFAAGVGPGSAPVVQVYGQDGVKLFGFTAFELSFTGGVSVATGDVNGDGVDDIVAGASIGGGPRVRVIDGKTGAEIANFFAFEESFRNGVTVAVGKLVSEGNAANASGFFREQIVVGAGDGGAPRVSSFDVLPGKGANPTRINNFFAFEDTFRNGVTVAAGDLTGDGVAEVITGSGIGGGPRVRAFTAAGSPTGVDFFAFDAGFRNGVSVAAGPLDASGKASIVAGVGPDGGSLVRVFNSTGSQTSQFAAFGDAATAAKAVRVGTAQFNASGPESILAGPGVGGGPLVRVFSAANPGGGPVFQDFAFEPPFRGGIFVG